MQIIQSIQARIYEIRGERVLLDKDLAFLYETETKALNLAVKRNRQRFPEDFMFQLSPFEWEALRFQFETLENNSSSFDNSAFKAGRGQHSKYLPYVFTEQGVAMLSGVLHSNKAINMNIAIMRAFVEIRKVLINKSSLKEQFKEIKEKLGNHDEQLNQLYEAMENLLDEKAAQQKWEGRTRIGYENCCLLVE